MSIKENPKISMIMGRLLILPFLFVLNIKLRKNPNELTNKKMDVQVSKDGVRFCSILWYLHIGYLL